MLRLRRIILLEAGIVHFVDGCCVIVGPDFAIRVQIIQITLLHRLDEVVGSLQESVAQTTRCVPANMAVTEKIIG